MRRLRDAKVLVAGLGGVGGYIVEALVRAGVGRVGLCDFDVIDITNINRQIYALTDTVGESKADVARARIQSINPAIEIDLYPFKIDAESMCNLPLERYDYVADAIDDVKAKIQLIRKSQEHNIPIICAMGTGNKLDPFQFKIDAIEKTNTCPLAKAVRKELRTLGIKGIPVLFSEERPVCQPFSQHRPTPASISYMPAIAGLMIASRIIKDLGCIE